MHWETVVLLLTNYFVRQRYTRNVIFLNCKDKSGRCCVLWEEWSSQVKQDKTYTDFVRKSKNDGIGRFSALFCVQDLANILKMTPAHQIQLTMIPLGENMHAQDIVETISDTTLDSLQIGILHDFDCPQSASILHGVIEKIVCRCLKYVGKCLKYVGKCVSTLQCSRESCFMPKFRWLIFEEYLPVNDSGALQALNSSDISVDAEITYLNLYNATNNEYDLFDVYNNAFQLGGQLKITRDSTMVVNVNGTSLTNSMRTQVAKYVYRDKLTDVTARVGVVVIRIFVTFYLENFKKKQ